MKLKVLQYPYTLLAKFFYGYTHLVWWIKYRTIDKYHIVNSGLEPGYYDTDTRILHANFQLLVDFVEIELASAEKHLCDGKGTPRELGLAYLDWKIHLQPDDPTNPSSVEWTADYNKQATEVKNLYLWWKDIRTVRKDEWDAVGLDKFMEEHPKTHEWIPVEHNGRQLFEMKSVLSIEDEKIYYKLIKKATELENERYEEDTNNIIRLMKIRHYLWT